MRDLAKFTQTEIGEQPKNLKEWSLNEGKLYKEYKFAQRRAQSRPLTPKNGF